MAQLQSTSITGTLSATGAVTLSNYGAGFVKLNAQGAVVMDTNTYATTGSLGSYLALSGGTMTGKILAVSTGTGTYDTAIEIRETGYATTSQSGWGYSPAMTFHWGGRYAKRFGMRSDGLFAVDDDPLALRSWVTSQGYVTGSYLPLSGGTMSGSIGMGGNNITNISQLSHTNGRIMLSGNLHIDAFNGNTVYLHYYNQGSTTYHYGALNMMGYDVTNQNIGYANNSFRAPIFYDSDNTSYYLDPAGSTSGYFAGVLRQNVGKYVRDSSYRTYSGSSDYYSGGSAGWYTVAQITLTTNCGGAVLYGTLYDHRYDGADTYQIAVVARSECDFSSNNESHYINVGCTILGSTNYTDYRSKIRVILSASSSGSRTYELQFYESPWNNDTWQLETTGWTIYTTPQAPSSGTGTARVNYISNQSADYQRANTAMYSPIYYDANDTGYYLNPNGNSNLYATVSVEAKARKNQSDNNYTTAALWTESYGATTTGIAFHISGVVGKFLEMRTNGTLYWNGDTVMHSGNANYAWNMNQYLRTSDAPSFQYIGVNPSGASNNGFGISLYGGASAGPTYGIFFQGTSTYGNHGSVTGDWATYFTMNNDDSRGWIWRKASTGNIASLSAGGVLQVDGSMRAPIFYDSNDTTFYLDPNATSNLYKIRVGNGGEVAGLIGMGASYLYGMGVSGAYTTVHAHPSANGVALGYFDGTTFTSRFYVNNDGNAYAVTGMYAPIFYDSQNTAYYLDPSNFSNLYSATFNSTVNLQATSWFGGYGPGSGPGIGLENQSTFARFAFWGLDFYDWNHGRQMLIDGNYIYVDNYLQAGNSLRAPIFYDSNDTTYYLDPNSSSRLRYLYVGDGGSNWSNPGGWDTTLYISGVNHAIIRVENRQNNYHSALHSHTGQLPGVGSPGDYDFRITRNWSNRMVFYTGYTYSEGYLQAADSLRAPIFYDSADTGYYLDLNSSSDSALRIRGGALFGANTSWGKYLYVGTNGRVGATATVAVTNGNLHIDCEDGYALYLNWYSTNNIYSRGNFGVGSDSASYRLHVHGTGYATSDFRAPIFYDSENTAYYGDFASTSKLNVLDANSIYTSGGLSTNGGNSLLGVQSPGGASRANGGSTETGAFKITFPAGIPVYGMFKLVIHIYEYGQRGNGYEIHCGGHMYPNYMYNRFQVQYGSSNTPLNVRYGNDGTYGCIWIGNIDTTWSYPQIWVSEFMMGYSNTSWTTWRSGWNISLVTSYGNSGAMDGPYTCDYGYAASAGSASTSSQVTINYNDNSNANYQLLWGSGNNVYGTGGVYVNPADDRVYANYFSSAYYMDVYTSAGSDYLRITDNQVYRPNGGILYLNWSSNANVAITGSGGGNVGVGNNSPSYKMHVSGDIYANGGWLRVSGTSGLYFESYGGGWRMTGSSYIESYGGKSLHMQGNSVDYVGSLYFSNAGHIQPNSGSYGSLQFTSTKNGWAGLYFSDTGATLMMNGNETGFYRQNYGWQWRWENGIGYIHTAANGGGTAYAILHAGNYTSYAQQKVYQGQSAGDWQNFTNDVGEFRVDEVLNINGGGHSNQPPSVYTYGGVLSWRTNNHSFQLYASHTGDITFKTQWGNDNYSGWRRILHEANYNSWAPSLTGGGASGTWGISITGNANYASSAGNADTVDGLHASAFATRQDGTRYSTNYNSILSSGFFNGEGTPTNSPNGYGQLIVAKGIDTGLQIAGGYNSQQLWFRGWGYGPEADGFYPWRRVLNDGADVYAANMNQYVRTSDGVTFGSVTSSGLIRVNGNNNLYLDYNYGCSIVGVYSSYRYQGVFAMGDSYKLPIDGTGPGNLYGMAWSHPNAGGQAGYLDSHGLLVIVNGITYSAISNSIWARGDVTAYSDARVKTNVEVIENAVEKIQSIRGVTFNRTDLDHDTVRHAGVIAQEVLAVLPEVVTTTKDGMHSVAYGNMAALFIEAIKEQQKQIEDLKNEIQVLKENK